MEAGAFLEVVVNDRSPHAESPLWSAAEGALYWVDTRLTRIYRYEIATGRRTFWEPASRLGAVGLHRDGLVVAEKNGVAVLNTSTSEFRVLVDPEASDEQSRINDAKVDRGGRFWVGYQEDFSKTATGTLYAIGVDCSVRAVDGGYVNPNGFTWSLDNRRMYVSDTRIRTIWVYDFDPHSGTASNRRVFAEVPADEGTPDGATVDSTDFVWSARNGGGCIVRYAPDGSLDRKIPIPALQVTNMTFGGADLRTMYVTTAWASLTQEQYWAQPLAGAILSLQVDVPGVEEPFFGG